MSMFKIIELQQNRYDACIVIQTHESLHYIKNDLSDIVDILNYNGKILLDTLLHVGNVNDRFIEVETNEGSINWTNAHVVDISKQDNIRKIVANTLMINPDVLENSILTSIQKKMLSKGIGI